MAAFRSFRPSSVQQLRLGFGNSRNTDVNTMDNKDSTLRLIEAANNGYTELVRSLLRCNVDVNVKGDKGFTPLHCAAQRGHRDVVSLLLTSNANVNAKRNDGSTPLHVAAQSGHKAIVELLLSSNSDVNARDNKGHIPLHLAVSKRKEGMPVFWAEWEDHKAVVDLLISNKADVNDKDNDGYTPLHLAAGEGCVDLVKLLLANKADVNARNNNGLTPLDWAVASGQMAEMVLANSARDEVMEFYRPRDRSSVSASNSTQSEGHRAVAKLLLAEMQRPKMSNGEGIRA
ncbi:MAG: ankyrin repeat domain-containing protein [Terracidiphilus sp.]